MSSTYIYGLIDPRSGEIRYVGKANDVQRRLREHLKPCALKANTHKINWIKSLLLIGLQPDAVTLDTVDVDVSSESEQAWITKLLKAGLPLTNGAEGGRGGNIGKEGHSKQAAVLRGRKVVRSDAHQQKLIAANKAKAVDPAWRTKISDAAKARAPFERERLIEQLKVAWFAPRTKRYECVCIGCGSDFVAKNTRKKYCKPQCCVNAWKRRDRSTQKQIEVAL